MKFRIRNAISATLKAEIHLNYFKALISIRSVHMAEMFSPLWMGVQVFTKRSCYIFCGCNSLRPVEIKIVKVAQDKRNRALLHDHQICRATKWGGVVVGHGGMEPQSLKECSTTYSLYFSLTRTC